ncbi:Asp-tRNA(Asn)/Glu-tRNA(Gln) amidotransferase subunit GatA [Hyphomicrobium sulfonivorans]|uniref:Glutamyl-tRNA(Gln) amidotransferase subunit A n=1 Tax=Hyphomicrobium sulfonivorans TaxID=121290 RepID=A0A109BKL6_HYPSL|nr:Asp-tRNA(Asn)/Glu-tRNA(Gln) amidotransferase subunit GatA [Hyphomicrobium sulfonivorans]KWT70556.1 Aspartyl-tRNA(Asn) amidotransferase subunit A Glutamyl-tRNA(Gln) amidotransferase subunit A [Hyphomicrobium sulfonivorans]MBI1650079.1 Asp-tRNA(Asn)/Glu-tRNA(Gln) amidotransferase subunit GatA [Hyphomicrobium sulfonivorans]NSL72996.1 Asp-tRNA(Asn)/Glu-tRNA(Gln) amidotransferase subunit GatA [Hyphomicrobium sulfonivorans]
MTDLTKLTIAEARDKLRKKEVSATELTQAFIDAIEVANPQLNAYVRTTPELALKQAEESDRRLKSGDARPLEGLPLGNKDLFCTKDVETTACSKILEGFTPTYESTVGSNLWNAGAVMLGKLNCDEFAMGSSNETSAYGPVVSPWRRAGADGQLTSENLVPGGSSGGSSAAVAADLCLGATATDTGGSIRQPAALTGTVGIKPTYGRCSRWGIVAFASSLDQAGPLAKTVRDAAIMLRSMASHDPKDSTSVETPVPDYELALAQGVKGLRVGVPKEYRVEGMSPDIERLWQEGIEWLKAAGATIHEVSLPHTKFALPTYYVVAPAEASSNLARYDGVRYGLRVEGKDLIDMYENSRAAGFGKEVQRRVLIGTYVLSAGYYDAYYLKAQKVRTLIKRDFDDAWQSVDVLLTPTTPTPAFKIGEKLDDPMAMYAQDIFTVTVNMAGLPGISVPAGISVDGLPLGLQLIGKPFDEATLFRAAQVIEDAAGHFKVPQRWWETAR